MSPLALNDTEVLNVLAAVSNEVTRLELLEFISDHHKICFTCRTRLESEIDTMRSLYFKITEFTSHPKEEMEEP